MKGISGIKIAQNSVNLNFFGIDIMNYFANNTNILRPASQLKASDNSTWDNAIGQDIYADVSINEMQKYPRQILMLILEKLIEYISMMPTLPIQENKNEDTNIELTRNDIIDEHGLEITHFTYIPDMYEIEEHKLIDVFEQYGLSEVEATLLADDHVPITWIGGWRGNTLDAMGEVNLERLFDNFDMNQDGSISTEEVRKGLNDTLATERGRSKKNEIIDRIQKKEAFESDPSGTVYYVIPKPPPWIGVQSVDPNNRYYIKKQDDGSFLRIDNNFTLDAEHLVTLNAQKN